MRYSFGRLGLAQYIPFLMYKLNVVDAVVFERSTENAHDAVYSNICFLYGPSGNATPKLASIFRLSGSG